MDEEGGKQQITIPYFSNDSEPIVKDIITSSQKDNVTTAGVSPAGNAWGITKNVISKINATNLLRAYTLTICYQLTNTMKTEGNNVDTTFSMLDFSNWRDSHLFEVTQEKPGSPVQPVDCPFVADTVAEMIGDDALHSSTFRTCFVLVPGMVYTIALTSRWGAFKTTFHGVDKFWASIKATTTCVVASWFYPGILVIPPS